MNQIAVCSYCGSENVKADAYAVWNTDTQQWEVSATFDKGAYCDECDGETRINWKEVA
jgi:ribosomal protein L37AE/L43A